MCVCLYISADLSKSESVLDYIVINQYLSTLQTPISHHCNTLQSPILQIAIFLYCRVQLALLHHLKGVGQIRTWMPQAASTFWPDPEINENR